MYNIYLYIHIYIYIYCVVCVIEETWAIDFDRDANFIASSGRNGRVNIWSVEVNKQEIEIENGEDILKIYNNSQK